MIKNQDRAKWFGASDTSYIMGNWETETFKKWWVTKIGAIKNDFSNFSMRAGTFWEHKIADAIGNVKKDRQIKKRFLRLRVNLDCEDKKTIYEIKTCKNEFKLSKAYWQQCQVQIFASKKPVKLVSYQFCEEELNNFFLPVDVTKLQFHLIEYDENWIKKEYLPRLKLLVKCMKRGEFPEWKS